MRSEGEFVTFKETPGCVHEDRVGDAVYEVSDALIHIFGLFGSLYSLVEDYTEGLDEVSKYRSFH